MLDLTFGEQVKIVLNRKRMTIKELAETIEERTGKKMSRQNLTQRLGRDNFQEQDMRMIAEILDCPFHLSILDEEDVERAAQEVEVPFEDPDLEAVRAEKQPEGPVQRFIVAGANHHEELIYSPVRDVTIGELADLGNESEAATEEVGEEAFETAEEPAEADVQDAEESEEAAAEVSEELEESAGAEAVTEATEGSADAEAVTEASEETAQTEAVTEATEETVQSEETPEETQAEQKVIEPAENHLGDEESYAKKKAVTNVFKEYIKKPLLRGYNKAHMEEEREAAAQDTAAEEHTENGAQTEEVSAEEKVPQPKLEVKGEINPYTGREYETNSVRMHPKRIGYVQVYDRADHKWTDMTEWAFLGYQERKKATLGKDYEPPIYLD